MLERHFSAPHPYSGENFRVIRWCRSVMLRSTESGITNRKIMFKNSNVGLYDHDTSTTRTDGRTTDNLPCFVLHRGVIINNWNNFIQPSTCRYPTVVRTYVAAVSLPIAYLDQRRLQIWRHNYVTCRNEYLIFTSAEFIVPQIHLLHFVNFRDIEENAGEYFNTVYNFLCIRQSHVSHIALKFGWHRSTLFYSSPNFAPVDFIWTPESFDGKLRPNDYKSVVKVEILRWGNCTCTLGTPCQCMWAPCWQLCPKVIIEPQSIYSFTKTVRLFFFTRCTVLR